MFKKKDGTEVDDAAKAPAPELDDAAYEDSWYRSLKAMAETHGAKGNNAEGNNEDEEDGKADPEA